MKNKLSITYIFAVLLFVIGIGIFLYPTISDMWNQYRNEQVITSYTKAVDGLEADRLEELWQEAEEYNRHHTVNTVQSMLEDNDEYVLSHPYDQTLDPDGDGLMGSIEIPKLKLNLAIYHGLGSEVLEKGIGHMEGTSLPIGGAGTHAVLAGHRGLPDAKLFTDLDQMKEGDLFFIHVLDKTLAYKVDQILTVLPNETESLQIIDGEDHVTLITCTPYGVNTHRLLIRGIRTDYEKDQYTADKTVAQKLAETDPKKVMILGLAILIIWILILHRIVRYRYEKRMREES